MNSPRKTHKHRNKDTYGKMPAPAMKMKITVIQHSLI